MTKEEKAEKYAEHLTAFHIVGGYVYPADVRKAYLAGYAECEKDKDAEIDRQKDIVKMQIAAREVVQAELAKAEAVIREVGYALEMTRAQWIHSVNADECVRALDTLKAYRGEK